jgi:hypothetical protein
MADMALFKALVTLRLVVFLLAFVIALQAFRGYRRNDSPAMLYLAGAFVLFGLDPFVTIVAARLSGGIVPPRFVMVTDVVVLGTAFLLVHQSLRLVEGGST